MNHIAGIDVPSWDDKVIGRFAYRVSLFKRRGLPDARAERLAERLVARDHERDDRRACAECKHLTREHEIYGRGCFAARQGWMRGVPRLRFSPCVDVLQRCERFEFQTPN